MGRAEAVTGDERWADGITAAANWFLGDNDTGVAMWDPDTGGAFDGLEAHGANRNQGTESTLALLSTLNTAVPPERLAMIGRGSSWWTAARSAWRLTHHRVITRLFVPGHEGFDQHESRSAAVLRRLLVLSDEDVQDSYDDVQRASMVGITA